VQGRNLSLAKLRSHVGVVTEKKLDAFGESCGAGGVQWSFSVHLRCVWVGSVLQQDLNAIHGIHIDGIVQSGTLFDPNVDARFSPQQQQDAFNAF